MPESQFGQSPVSLEVALDELVALARHLRATPADVSSRLTRLEGLTQVLTYFSTPIRAVEDRDGTLRVLPHITCSFADCTQSSHDLDACLLNFAQRDEPPIWLCRDHHPPLGDGDIRPPGWAPPRTETERVEAERKAALSRLSRDQLRLVNSRVGG
jgi:hypothetical protein